MFIWYNRGSLKPAKSCSLGILLGPCSCSRVGQDEDATSSLLALFPQLLLYFLTLSVMVLSAFENAVYQGDTQ